MAILRIPPRHKEDIRKIGVTNPLFRMFLEGLRGIYEIKHKKPYNYYSLLFTMLGSVFLSQYLIKLSKSEHDQRKRPNLLIPSYIYKVRRESFIYWEQSRLAHGLSTTFSYYDWDSQSSKMYTFDRKGNSTVVELHNLIENKEDMASVFLQKHYPAPAQLHHQIIMYTRKIDNPYDLDNHLQHKSVNVGDWIRAGYYAIYKELGLSNRFRHDEYVFKPKCYYDLQKLKLAFRISKDRKQLYKYIDTLEWNRESIFRFFVWFI